MSGSNTTENLSFPSVGDWAKVGNSHPTAFGRVGKVRSFSAEDGASYALVDFDGGDARYIHIVHLTKAETAEKALIDEVKEVVNEYADVLKDRVREYGSPEDSFTTIGESWATKIRAKMARLEPGELFTLSASEVGMLLEDFKMCRIWGGINKDDSFGDKTMYSAMSHVLMRREEKE